MDPDSARRVWTCDDCDSESHAARCRIHDDLCERCCPCPSDYHPRTQEDREARVQLSAKGWTAGRTEDRAFEQAHLRPYNEEHETAKAHRETKGTVDSYLAELVAAYASGPWLLPKDMAAEGSDDSPPNLDAAVDRATAVRTSADFATLESRCARYFGTAVGRALIGVVARIAPNDVQGAWRIARSTVDNLLGTRSEARARDLRRDRSDIAMIAVARACTPR